jgi:MoaA/NifB/PqqE/SkfB family radical SAM enzyme
MKLKRLYKLIKRIAGEIILDLRSKDYAKMAHFLYFLPKQIFLKYPKNISIEPINACNLQCEFCSSPPKLLHRSQKSLSFSEFKKIIDDIKDVTHYLWLFLAGEPFLNLDFPKMVAYTSKNHLHTTTSSNIQPLNKEKAREIVEAGLDCLIVSFDGATKETYEQMRLGGDFKKLVRNINFILQEKKRQKKLKPEIHLQFLVSKINFHEKEKFVRLARGLDVKYCFKTFAVPSWIYQKEKCQTLAQKYLPHEGRYASSSKLKRDILCANRERSFILSDGTICICCYDIDGRYKIGNIFSEKFLDVWKSKKYINVRGLMAQRKLPLCKVCGETNELYE